MMLLEFDAGLALHIFSALGLHKRDCRDNGVPFPAELEQVATTCWRIARGDPRRPEPTPLVDLVEALHARPVPKLLHTIADVATALDISERKVERLIATGALRSVLIGRARRVRDTDLRAYVDGLGGSFRNSISTKAASAGRRPPSALAAEQRPGRPVSTRRPASPASAADGAA